MDNLLTEMNTLVCMKGPIEPQNCVPQEGLDDSAHPSNDSNLMMRKCNKCKGRHLTKLAISRPKGWSEDRSPIYETEFKEAEECLCYALICPEVKCKKRTMKNCECVHDDKTRLEAAQTALKMWKKEIVAKEMELLNNRHDKNPLSEINVALNYRHNYALIARKRMDLVLMPSELIDINSWPVYAAFVGEFFSDLQNVFGRGIKINIYYGSSASAILPIENYLNLVHYVGKERNSMIKLDNIHTYFYFTNPSPEMKLIKSIRTGGATVRKLEKMIESAMGEPNTCKGITKKGERCKTSLKIPSYCWRHEPSKN